MPKKLKFSKNIEKTQYSRVAQKRYNFTTGAADDTFFWHTLCIYVLSLYILKIIFLKVFKLMWKTNPKEYENLKTKVLFYSLKIDVQFEFWKSKLTKSKCKWTYLFKVGGEVGMGEMIQKWGVGVGGKGGLMNVM